MLVNIQREQGRHEQIDVVLVSPRNPLNIGAAARAMANFGFSRLSVVAPYAPHWREAKSAVGAPEILTGATISDQLGDAVRHCTLVAGTGTLTYRKPEQRVVQLPLLPSLIREELARGGRIALVFGSEKHGLTREDLTYCHVLVEIPTDARQPSMNLGQAVAVCLYELAAHSSVCETGTQKETEARPNAPSRIATSGELDLLAHVIEQVMEAAHYSPASMRDANRHDVRLLLRRLAPSKNDIRRILGLFRRVLWRLQRKA